MEWIIHEIYINALNCKQCKSKNANVKRIALDEYCSGCSFSVSRWFFLNLFFILWNFDLYILTSFSVICVVEWWHNIIVVLIWTHRRSQSHAMSAKCRKWSPFVGWCTHMWCIRIASIYCTINSYWYFTCCWAKFLIQTSIRTYPHVVFSYFHLFWKIRIIIY